MKKLGHLAVMPLALVLAGLGGCATINSLQATAAHDNLDAVAWLQTSTEYAAVTRSLYASATARAADIAGSSAERGSGMAIVMDVDETVLDNSRYQAQLISDGEAFGSESWDRWIALRAATAVPGVVDFIRESHSLGFHLVFVTNRACRGRADTTDDCPQHQETLENLRQVGIDTQLSTLYLRGEQPPERCRDLLSESELPDGVWSSDKTSRRNCVALDREIALLFGDQLGDFVEIERSGREQAEEFDDRWGKSWFMLPNPTYGDWQPGDSADKRALIRGIN